jgi:hypothetical protein
MKERKERKERKKKGREGGRRKEKRLAFLGSINLSIGLRKL